MCARAEYEACSSTPVDEASLELALEDVDELVVLELVVLELEPLVAPSVVPRVSSVDVVATESAVAAAPSSRVA
jgi:hypothetical protein